MNFKLFFFSTVLCFNAYGCDERSFDSSLDQIRQGAYITEQDDRVRFNIFNNTQVYRFKQETKLSLKARKQILLDMQEIVRTFDDTSKYVEVLMDYCDSFYAFHADYKDDVLSALNIDKSHMIAYVDKLYSRESWEIYDENRKKTYWAIAKDFSRYWGDDNLLHTYSKFTDGPYMSAVDFAREELKSRIQMGKYSFEESLLILELLSYSLGIRILPLRNCRTELTTKPKNKNEFLSIHLIGILGYRYNTIQEIQDTGILNNKGTLYVHYSEEKKQWRVIPVEYEQPFTYGCDLCYENFQKAIEAQKTQKYNFSFKNLYRTIEEFLFAPEDDE